MHRHVQNLHDSSGENPTLYLIRRPRNLQQEGWFLSQAFGFEKLREKKKKDYIRNF